MQNCSVCQHSRTDALQPTTSDTINLRPAERAVAGSMPGLTLVEQDSAQAPGGTRPPAASPLAGIHPSLTGVRAASPGQKPRAAPPRLHPGPPAPGARLKSPAHLLISIKYARGGSRTGDRAPARE